MATAAVTYTFASGATIASSQVNTNYADLVSFLNTHPVQKDGSPAFTGQPTYTGTVTTASANNLLNVGFAYSYTGVKVSSGTSGTPGSGSKTSLGGSVASGSFQTVLSSSNATFTNGVTYVVYANIEAIHSSLTGGDYPLVMRVNVGTQYVQSHVWFPGGAGSTSYGQCGTILMPLTYSQVTGTQTPTLQIAHFGVGTTNLGWYGGAYCQIDRIA